MLKAVTRQASLVDAKVAQINASADQQHKGTKLTTAQFFDHHATKEDVAVMVKEEDFLQAMKELIPSVSAGELEHYESVKRQFENVDHGATGTANSKDIVSAPVLDGSRERRDLESPTALPERPRSKGKSKEKVVDKKGKGKPTSYDESDEETNGNAGRTGYRGKGKGKAVDMSFQDDEDEELY